MLVALVCAAADVTRSRIVMDENGIDYRHLVGRTAMRWSEIDDLCVSPRFLVVSARSRRIKAFRGE